MVLPWGGGDRSIPAAGLLRGRAALGRPGGRLSRLCYARPFSCFLAGLALGPDLPPPQGNPVVSGNLLRPAVLGAFVGGGRSRGCLSNAFSTRTGRFFNLPIRHRRPVLPTHRQTACLPSGVLLAERTLYLAGRASAALVSKRLRNGFAQNQQLHAPHADGSQACLALIRSRLRVARAESLLRLPRAWAATIAP